MILPNSFQITLFTTSSNVLAATAKRKARQGGADAATLPGSRNASDGLGRAYRAMPQARP